MEHTVTVRKAASGTNAGAGNTTTYAVRTAGVACLINAPFRTAQDRNGQTQLVGTVTVATFDGSVQPGDSFLVTAGPPYVGAVLHVTGLKGQPGLDALGFDQLFHYQADHVS